MTQHQTILLGDDDVREIVDAVTASFVHLSSYAAQASGDCDPTRPNEIWAGWIGVSGSYNGGVALRCTRGFAHHAARAMFGSEEGKLGDEAARDALAELTNIVGGNIKSLLSATTHSTCRLSLPTISVGPPDLRGFRTAQQWDVKCGDERIVVTLLDASGAGTDGA